MEDFETLLSGSSILLFGRAMNDISINRDYYEKKPTIRRRGANKLLEQSIISPKSKFARIFGYSYEGRYYEMAAPAIFLVHGDGDDPEDLRPFDGNGRRRVAPGPSVVDKTGLPFQVGHFAVDIKVWSYEKADFSIRLDMSTGMLEEILLHAEADEDDWHGQVGGGKVGGGKVGGGKVGGGKVGGGKLGGGKVGG